MKKLTKSEMIIAVIIVVILIGGTGYYIFQKRSAPSLMSEQLMDEVTPSTFTVGMTKYTDNSYGFSFWYPTSWVVKEEVVTDPTNDGWYKDGKVVKRISVTNPDSSSTTSGVIIDEFQSPSLSITELGQTKSASPVGVDQTYYFDKNLHTWMYKNLTDGPAGNRPSGTITAADISYNTMGGLHVFGGAARHGADTIVPLSASNFLVIWTQDPGGYTNQQYLINTIVATDPEVATPVNIKNQIQTVQQEAVLYGVLGTPIEDGLWYKDDKHVYDSGGNVLPEADPSTFVSINNYSDGYMGKDGSFAKDRTHVYYTGDLKSKMLEGADPMTFSLIRQTYHVTQQGTGKQLTFADASYQKDKNYVWYEAKRILGADPNTFMVTSDSIGDSKAKDANHSYLNGMIVDTRMDKVTVSIPGMSKYTDSDFGFLFWYPSAWSVTNQSQISGTVDRAGNLQKGSIVIQGDGVKIDIDKIYSDKLTYNVAAGACGYCSALKYYFDPVGHLWMVMHPVVYDNTNKPIYPGSVPIQADISNNTMGGLHMFSTEQKEDAKIIPLSARNFLLVTGVTYSQQCGPACASYINGEVSLLANTIVATDPAVATPVSPEQQRQTVQVEKNAYILNQF